MYQQTDLFAKLCQYHHVTPDRRGEAWIPCPNCGKPPKHFSFSAKGAFCFVCQYKASLLELARRYDLRDVAPVYHPAPKPRKTYSWLANPEPLLRQYESHPRRVELWRKHKPVSVETITRRRLGVGILPASHCHHERLIVPILDGTMVVGLRGRWIGCECDPRRDKWLVSGGTLLDSLPMYGLDQAISGGIVWLVENCVDALLISQNTPYTGAAIYSVSYWRPEWVETLKAVSPEYVVVALDNDLVGNGGAWQREKFIREWRQEHPNGNVPESAGIRITNLLRSAGLDARLWDWENSPKKSDIGGIISEIAPKYP